MDTELKDLVSDVTPAAGAPRERAWHLLGTEIDAAPTGVTTRWRRGRIVAAIAAVLAVPATIAIASALQNDVVDNFGGFLHGETSGRELGRPVGPGDNPPRWFDSDGYTDQLVIATLGEHRLYMARNENGDVSFSLDGAVAISSGGGANPFVNQFQGNSVVPLMTGPLDQDDRLPYAGIVAPDVATVELRFDSGATQAVEPDGAGFIFKADLGRVERDNVLIVDQRPTEVVALDEEGNVLQSVPAQCQAGMFVMELRSDYSGATPDGQPAPRAGLKLPAGAGEYFDVCDER